jgi:transcriptional regulator with XRE-family HTH domain
MSDKYIKTTVNPKILFWARSQKGWTRHYAAQESQKLQHGGVTAKAIHSWEEGLTSPTIFLARQLAKTYDIPFAFLYLRKIPEREWREWDRNWDEPEQCRLCQTEVLNCHFIRAWGCYGTYDQLSKHCQRFYHVAEIKDIAPGLWEGDYCCRDWAVMFINCAEDTGYNLGAFDLRHIVSDGKDVWRNYYRVRFKHCPFCGEEALPSPETLRTIWEGYKYP